MCTFLLQNAALWDMGLVHCGICGTGLLQFNHHEFRAWMNNYFHKRPCTLFIIHAISLTHWPMRNFNEILGHVIFKQISEIDGWGISCEIAPIWMSLDLTYDQSTLVRVMAWCRQATSHYLSQCWPRSLTSYGVTRPRWVNGRSVELSL